MKTFTIKEDSKGFKVVDEQGQETFPFPTKAHAMHLIADTYKAFAEEYEYQLDMKCKEVRELQKELSDLKVKLAFAQNKISG